MYRPIGRYRRLKHKMADIFKCGTLDVYLFIYAAASYRSVGPSNTALFRRV